MKDYEISLKIRAQLVAWFAFVMLVSPVVFMVFAVLEIVKTSWWALGLPWEVHHKLMVKLIEDGTIKRKRPESKPDK